MTASWTMEAANQKRVTLSFNQGRSAPHGLLQGMVGHNRTSARQFDNQEDADHWAAELGVERWRVVEHCRAFPQAAFIPITFAEAPDDERLHQLIESYASGTPLEQLAAGVMVNTGVQSFEVHPYLLRLWLIGAQPDHPELQRLKLRR